MMDKDTIIKQYGSYENWKNYNACRLVDPTKKLDIGIFDFLIKLNKHGLHTIFSCSGHKEGDVPYVIFATYVDRDKIVKEMDNMFGKGCHYRLTKIVDRFGAELVESYQLRIYPEDMEHYGIFYCEKR